MFVSALSSVLVHGQTELPSCKKVDVMNIDSTEKNLMNISLDCAEITDITLRH